jgi:hypothetical protein
MIRLYYRYWFRHKSLTTEERLYWLLLKKRDNQLGICSVTKTKSPEESLLWGLMGEWPKHSGNIVILYLHQTELTASHS